MRLNLKRLTGGLRADDAGGAAPVSRDPLDDFWYGRVGGKTAAGVHVTVDEARKLPVVRGCLGVLSQSVAGLAFGLFRKTAGDQRERVDMHPVLDMLRDPNPGQTSFEFFDQMVDDLASEGAWLAEIVPGSSPRKLDLWRIARAHYAVEQLADRSLRFVVNEPGRPTRKLLRDEVWFIPLPPQTDPTCIRSPILDDGREAIGAGLGLQRYANAFFSNDATPPMIFKHKGQFADQASKDNFLSAWMRWATGRNRHRPAVLEYGMEVQQIAHSNEQAQFLETRKELWLDITRLWRVPPHKVGILDRATHSNIEHQGLEFVTDTLMPWLELIERSVGKWFLTDDPDVYFEFNVASLLRGDVKARFEAYALARQWGWLSVNDIRRMENQNGIGRGGDRYIEPLNMLPVGSDGQRDETVRQRQEAIAFLRKSVAANGGRPNLRVA